MTRKELATPLDYGRTTVIVRELKNCFNESK